MSTQSLASLLGCYSVEGLGHPVQEMKAALEKEKGYFTAWIFCIFTVNICFSW